MKIAFIIGYVSGSFPKLSETFILNEITGLIDLGHEVDIYASTKGEESKVHASVEKYDLINHTYYRNMPKTELTRLLKAPWLIISLLKKNPRALLRSLNFFKYGKDALALKLLYATVPCAESQPYDIIQCHFGPAGNLGVLLRDIGVLRGKVVTKFHGHDIRKGITRGGDIYTPLREKGDCFLAISSYNYGHLLDFGFDPRKIVSHPVGVDTTRFHAEYRGNNKNDRPLKILTVARLVEEKGLEYGIKSIYQLLKRNPHLNIQYEIIGGGELEESLKKLVADLKLEAVVRFAGPLIQDDVLIKMQDADIFLLPSVAEALPVVLMEAQSMGLPVIATNVGGITDIVADGKSGFIVPPQDLQAIVNKLEYLISHPESCEKMGEYGRKHIVLHYDLNKLNQDLVKIYSNLIQS